MEGVGTCFNIEWFLLLSPPITSSFYLQEVHFPLREHRRQAPSLYLTLFVNISRACDFSTIIAVLSYHI
jgi:hypothetical protein